MTKADRAARVARIFDEAVELATQERTAFLDRACAGDATLRKEVESLLAADNSASSFLEMPAVRVAGDPFDTGDHGQMVGREIGSYRIIDVLGTGGMSVVYLAEQEQPKRTVALKVIKPGMATPSILRRFGHEAQILGRLQHPGIAQVYEAGTADTGAGPQPFFAMELIKGVPLGEYARARNLGTRQRLALLAKVCDAVQHAHQKGIIHRDLKPANILVDDTGQPKVLDFGIARATDSDIQATTLRTDIGQLIGTIPYMSPEQVAGDPAALDARSDIYALGVLCYELLAGRLPYDVRKKMIAEAVRVIREDDPTPLSSINKVFRGDVETIVAKALEKDPARRYDSAAGLAADIQRYLDDEPIVARPPSALYQLRKFSKRNRALVGGVAAAFALLVLGIVGTSWQAVRAGRAELDARLLAESEAAQKVKAQRAAETAIAVNDFLLHMLASADPRQRGVDVTVLQVLDAAAERIETELEGHSDVEAALRETIGNTYRSLGEPGKAEAHLLRSLVLRRELFGDRDETVGAGLFDLAELRREAGEYADAKRLYDEALPILRQTLGDSHKTVAAALNGLGLLMQAIGNYDAAEAHLREGLAINRDVLGEHKTTALAMVNLASALQDQRKHDEAKQLYAEALEMNRLVLGEEHIDLALNLDNLATLVADMGDNAQAERMHREALDMRRRLLPESHPLIALSLNNVAYVLRVQDHYAEAETMYRQALDIRRATLNSDHPEVAISLNNLGDVLVAQGQYAQAAPLFEEAVAIAERALPPGHLYTAYFRGNYGKCLVKLDRHKEAKRQLIKCYRTLRGALELGSPRIHGTLEALIEVYEATGKPDKAQEYRALLTRQNQDEEQ